LTPHEINLKIESHNREHRANDIDIFELAALITIGFNNPKSFPSSLQKFRPDPVARANDISRMKQQAGMVGVRIPEKSEEP
jgi:hypothetical protein